MPKNNITIAFETKAMTSVLEKVEPLSDTDRKKFEKVEAKSRAKTKKEKLEGFKLTIETACPDEWGTFLKCWNSKSKNYKVGEDEEDRLGGFLRGNTTDVQIQTPKHHPSHGFLSFSQKNPEKVYQNNFFFFYR